ncbi:MAG: hypothetical protein GXO43_06460 [Crenarchaeota archaeon]|nr:hypothetical protein [Thermoproteota archaeon]
MIGSKAIGISIAVLLILMIVYSNLMLARAVIGDSPSIYNNGPGGVSYFFTTVMLRHSPIVIMSFDELHQYAPWLHALFIISPDKPISMDDALKVLNWVKNGGEVIVMDETSNTVAFLKLVGAAPGAFVGYIVMGICRVNNMPVPVLFDVYQTFSKIDDGKPLCWASKSVVAFEKKIGKGEVIVIGDSSLIINYMLLDTRYGAPNIYFIKQLVGPRSVLIYEGGRAYRIIYSVKGVMTINSIMTVITSIPSMFFAHQGILKIVALLGLWLVVTGFISLYLFSFPRTPYPKLKKIAKPKALITGKEIMRGLKDWGVKTSKKE